MKLSKKLRVSLPRHYICRRDSNLESKVGTASSESFAVQALLSDMCIVQCAHNPVHLAESATQSGSSRLQSSIKFGNINKQLQLLFAETLSLKLHYSDIVTFC